MTFALILPTFNEIDGMRWCVPKIDRSLFEEIILVDGGSTDGTFEYATQEGLTVLRQPGSGLTDAEEFAFANMSADVFLIFTPDGNSLPEVLPAVCEAMRRGYDMVIASRYIKGAKSEDDDHLTSFGNWMFTRTINILFNARYTDSLVAYRAITRDAILQMKLPEMSEPRLRRYFPRMNSWETGSSIRAAILKLKIAEIPGDEPKRIGGVRKMSVVKNGLGVLFQILYDFLFYKES